MVVFICGNCGESVKKAAVDKHCQTKCRNCVSLSCIDCLKDFPGDTFRSHNQCMTEEQKWHGTDYKPKTGNNTGQKKQDAWMDSIQNAIPAAKSSNPHLAEALQKLLNYENVPRKETKFKNFLKNSIRIHNHQIVTAIWTIVSNVKVTPVPPSVPRQAAKENGIKDQPVPPIIGAAETGLPQSTASEDDSIEPAKKKARIAPSADADSETVESDPLNGDALPKKFRWKKEIRNLLQESPDAVMSLKKLKKRVVRRYETSADPAQVTDSDLAESFEKYLRKYPDLFVVEEKQVRLQISS